MSESKKNGLLPGWPSFHKFKKEMAELYGQVVDEKLKPVTEDIRVLKNSLLSHISKTQSRFDKVEQALTNHITDTNKKISHLDKTVNKKLDRLLKLSVNKPGKQKGRTSKAKTRKRA